MSKLTLLLITDQTGFFLRNKLQTLNRYVSIIHVNKLSAKPSYLRAMN